jgi:hypothetical protein
VEGRIETGFVQLKIGLGERLNKAMALPVPQKKKQFSATS